MTENMIKIVACNLNGFQSRKVLNNFNLDGEHANANQQNATRKEGREYDFE